MENNKTQATIDNLKKLLGLKWNVDKKVASSVHPYVLEDAIEILERVNENFKSSQCFCPSYVDDNGKLRDCTCGKCASQLQEVRE